MDLCQKQKNAEISNNDADESSTQTETQMTSQNHNNKPIFKKSHRRCHSMPSSAHKLDKPAPDVAAPTSIREKV